MRRPEMLTKAKMASRVAAGCQMLENPRTELEPPGGMGEPEQRQGRHRPGQDGNNLS
jgi:hypothetical protein